GPEHTARSHPARRGRQRHADGLARRAGPAALGAMAGQRHRTLAPSRSARAARPRDGAARRQALLCTRHDGRGARYSPQPRLAWGLAFALIALQSMHQLPAAWWWTQAVTAAMGVMVIVQLTWSNRREPHPFAVVLRRFGVIVVGTWILLTVAIASADQSPALR